MSKSRSKSQWGVWGAPAPTRALQRRLWVPIDIFCPISGEPNTDAFLTDDASGDGCSPHHRMTSNSMNEDFTCDGRALVYHVVHDAASTVTLCDGSRGEHQYTMCWMARRAPVHYVYGPTAAAAAAAAAAGVHLHLFDRVRPRRLPERSPGIIDDGVGALRGPRGVREHLPRPRVPVRPCHIRRARPRVYTLSTSASIPTAAQELPGLIIEICPAS